MAVRAAFFRLVVGSAPGRKPWSRVRRASFQAATERRQGEFREKPDREKTGRIPGAATDSGRFREKDQRQAPGDRRRSDRQRMTRDKRRETDSAGKQRRAERVRPREAEK